MPPSPRGTEPGDGLRNVQLLAWPVEISYPIASAPPIVEVRHAGRPLGEPRWNGDLVQLTQCVARRRGVALEELCSRTHRRAAVEGRRVALVAGTWLLRRPRHEVAAALTIGASSASELLHQGMAVLAEARAVAAELRAMDADTDAAT